MKIPFSYKQNFFRSVLIFSCIGHGILFAQAGFIAPAPQYAVVQAPASVEVILVEEKIEKVPVIQEKVMTAVKPQEKNPEVVQKEPEKKAPPKVEKKPVYISPVRGALTEQKPVYLKNPAPVYPYRARLRGWEGVVLLHVLVGKAGRPEKIEIKNSSGYQVLDEAAREAVQKWRFKPAGMGEITFEAWIDIPVRFVLDQA